MDNGVIIVEREMILADVFQSEFKGVDYTIYRFVDGKSLNIFNATNIKGDFEVGNVYLCSLAYKKNKLVVISAE